MAKLNSLPSTPRQNVQAVRPPNPAPAAKGPTSMGSSGFRGSGPGNPLGSNFPGHPLGSAVPSHPLAKSPSVPGKPYGR